MFEETGQENVVFICQLCLLEESFTIQELHELKKKVKGNPICWFHNSEGVVIDLIEKSRFLESVTFDALKKWKSKLEKNQKLLPGYRRLVIKRIDHLLKLLKIPTFLWQLARKVLRKEKADKWFNKENPALEGKKPRELMKTAGGRKKLKEILGAINNGLSP